jgi:D-glycero-D-manno-heptose 1,7-bisphosphate phosphatase
MIHHYLVVLLHNMNNQITNIIFLDRDGVINVKANEGEYITSWNHFQFLPKVVSTLRSLSTENNKLFIITNQQCIGKKIITSQQLAAIHKKMLHELAKASVTIEDIYICPHLEADECECRKPKPGMLHRVISDNKYYGDNRYRYYMIGDNESDIIAGNAIGCTTVLFCRKCDQSVINHSEANYIIQDITDLGKILKAN